MSDPEPLDTCGCCEGEAPVGRIENAPGLPALRYRLSTHGEFLERMLHAVPRTPERIMPPRPLAALTSRSPDDPTVAMLDACAVVGDILTFYQERIANEGYLRTATERRSVLELARAIGYELSPGVAASVYLAFRVEDAPGAPLVSDIAAGWQVQSVPPQGKLPQVFETSAPLTARAEWNELRPRLTRPAELAIMAGAGSPGAPALVLLGPHGTFPAGTPGLHEDLDPNDLHRLDTTEPSAARVDALEIRRTYLTDAAAGIAKGDLLLFAGRKGTDVDVLVLRVAACVDEPERRRIRVDLEPLPAPSAPPPAFVGAIRIPYVSRVIAGFATVGLAKKSLTGTTLATEVASQNWRERDLQALLGIQGWGRRTVMRAMNNRKAAPPLTLEAGAFTFREKVAFFGHTAPKWKSLPATNTKGNAYQLGWDTGDVNGTGSPAPTLSDERRIWTDSQGNKAPDQGPHAYLERPVKGLTTQGWTIFESPTEGAEAYAIEDARERSRADYGISGRATALTLRDPNGTRLAPTTSTSLPGFTFRRTTAHVGSRRLEFADLPIDTPIPASATEIELDRVVLGLAAGQPIAVTGERVDLAGIDAAEIAILTDIVHSGGRTTLRLERGLAYGYVRDTMRISANVVHATHGETVSEVLGNGDATVPNQRFTLKKPPLTYVSAPTPRGVRPTLEVRVNRVAWEETTSLYLEGPDRETFVVRIDDDARADVVFGDGEHGARLPTGSANVTATYRSGIGPDGEVEANTLTLLRSIPLGIRSVGNPVDASGAEGPERLENARVNAPMTVVTFDRVISLTDFEDFARTFPGVGKARGDRLWVDGRDVVHVTVAGATGGAPGGDVTANLRAAIRSASDGSQPFHISPFAQRYFTCEASVVVDPRYVAEEVLEAAAARLREHFSFEKRTFAQPVTPAEVITEIHAVPGVVAVDLDMLAPYAAAGTSGLSSEPQPLAARGARWDPATRAFEPAELLLVNPVGIILRERE